MAAGAPPSDRFRRDVERALGGLSFALHEPVVDGFVDAAGAARRVRRRGGSPSEAVLVRAAPVLPSAKGDFGPSPAAPCWVRVSNGPAIRWSPLRGGPAEGPVDDTVKALRLEVEAVVAPGAKTPERSLTRLVMDLAGGDSLVVSERLGATEAASRAGAADLAHALAEALEVEPPARATDAPEEAPAPDDDAAESVKPLAAVDLARWMFRFEGQVGVLRDYDSQGPRDRVRSLAGAALGFGLAAIATWLVFARQVTGGDAGWALLLGLGAAGAVLTVTAYAFAGVARYASKYRADSRPLLWIGVDRFVALPWVDRRGAVDLRHEGRLGAAIPLREVWGATVQARDEAFAVEIGSEHGPIDAVSGLDRPRAEWFRRAIEGWLKDAADPLAVAKRRAKRAA